jgi:integrase
MVLVDPVRLLPRFWATAWSVGLAGRSPAANTLRTQLRHIDAFYSLCDERFGQDSLDVAISARDASALQRMIEAFYLSLTATPTYKTTTVQRWDAVRGFVQSITRQFGVGSESFRALAGSIEATGRIRTPRRGRFKFARALPPETLRDLLEVAEPGSSRNPFDNERAQWRNWIILHLLLRCGLRRGEALLLTVDALKRDVDRDTGEWVHWLDVTTSEGGDPRATRPSIKTHQSHRQIPVSADLADLYEQYVSEYREPSDAHGFLLTSRDGAPLSAESVNRIFERLSAALSKDARERFRARTGGKRHVSPHDLRHTCATARYSLFMAQDHDRELSMQRMRAYFGWSMNSHMPELYARAAIQDDLLRAWNDLFDRRVRSLRAIRP